MTWKIRIGSRILQCVSRFIVSEYVWRERKGRWLVSIGLECQHFFKKEPACKQQVTDSSGLYGMEWKGSGLALGFGMNNVPFICKGQEGKKDSVNVFILNYLIFPQEWCCDFIFLNRKKITMQSPSCVELQLPSAWRIMLLAMDVRRCRSMHLENTKVRKVGLKPPIKFVKEMNQYTGHEKGIKISIIIHEKLESK